MTRDLIVLQHARGDGGRSVPPCDGIELQAWAALTLLRGGVVWDGEHFLGRAGAGRFLRCDRPEAGRPRPRQNTWRHWTGLEQ